MPETEVRLFQVKEDEVPLLDWLDQLPEKVQDKCHGAIIRLGQRGFELCVESRKEAAYLEKGIYELRVRRGHVNYRMLYFFHGRQAIILSHGLTKENRVPQREINIAVRRMHLYERNPDRHTYRIRS